MTVRLPQYRLGEELCNAISHGVGAIAAIVGTVWLLGKATDGWQKGAAIVYGVSLTLMFLMSCLYHALTAPKAKYIFRIFDHSAVALLIAGTYTPYTLVALRGTVGWILFAVVWSCTALTILLSVIDMDRFKVPCLMCNLASGWCIIGAIVPLLSVLPTGGVWLLVAGGVAYTVGIVFYRLKTVPYAHAVWHLFVLLGATLQYFSLYGYVFG